MPIFCAGRADAFPAELPYEEYLRVSGPATRHSTLSASRTASILSARRPYRPRDLGAADLTQPSPPDCCRAINWAPPNPPRVPRGAQPVPLKHRARPRGGQMVGAAGLEPAKPWAAGLQPARFAACIHPHAIVWGLAGRANPSHPGLTAPATRSRRRHLTAWSRLPRATHLENAAPRGSRTRTATGGTTLAFAGRVSGRLHVSAGRLPAPRSSGRWVGTGGHVVQSALGAHAEATPFSRLGTRQSAPRTLASARLLSLTGAPRGWGCGQCGPGINAGGRTGAMIADGPVTVSRVNPVTPPRRGAPRAPRGPGFPQPAPAV